MITETEAFLIDRYRSLLNLSKEQGKLTSNVFVNLSLRQLADIDDIEQAYQELLHFLENHEYYDTIERIEKGEALYEAETDPNMRKRYKVRLDELKAKLDALEAKEDAA